MADEKKSSTLLILIIVVVIFFMMSKRSTPVVGAAGGVKVAPRVNPAAVPSSSQILANAAARAAPTVAKGLGDFLSNIGKSDDDSAAFSDDMPSEDDED